MADTADLGGFFVCVESAEEETREPVNWFCWDVWGEVVDHVVEYAGY